MGATGGVGGAVLQKLGTSLAPGHTVRTLSRSPLRETNAGGCPLESLTGNIADPAVLDRALDGVDALLLVMGDHPGMAELEIGIIEAARRHGTVRIVKISAITAGLMPRVSFGIHHGKVEDALLASGLPFVILRPTFFFQSLELFRDPISRGILPAATKGGAIGFVDRRDVATAAANALLSPHLDGTIHTLTGPLSLTMAEVAVHLGEALGHKVRHISPPAFLMPLMLRLGAGLDPWLARQVADLMTCCAKGGEDRVTDDITHLTGKSPTGFGEYLSGAGSAFMQCDGV